MLQESGRNKYGKDNFYLSKVEDYSSLKNFDCGREDLNEYFQKDVIDYHKDLLSQTYTITWATKEDEILVALIDFCNDAVRSDKAKGGAKEFIRSSDGIDNIKNYPAVKITRFGVQKDFQGDNIGTHIMNMVKEFFLFENRTGCRLLTVDAYNTANAHHKRKPTSFYEKNGFQFFSNKDESRETRSMFFDLKRLNSE